MQENIPLVVPEVNPEALSSHSGIIANPNCSTIQMVAALQPIREKFGLKRIIVSTYQAVSGAGAEAIEELESQSAQFKTRAETEANILPSASAENDITRLHLMPFLKSMHSIHRAIHWKSLK